jgi:hypothetical protein
MTPMDGNSKKRGNYGPFALAVALYVSGAIGFAAWSYYQHSHLVTGYIDQSLINATHSVEQILGAISIECAVETESNESLGASSQGKLDHFAEACGFDALGAIVRRGTNTWILIAGTRHSGNVPQGDIHFQDKPGPRLTATILDLARSGKEVRVQNILHEKYGSLRLAVRYHPLSPDTGYALAVSQNVESVHSCMRSQAIQSGVGGLFLVAMVFPLILLYNRARTQTTRQLAKLNAQLQQDFVRQKKREAELEDAIRDLERFNAVTLGRETRIIELKAEVNTLLKQMKRKKRYNVDSTK